MEAGAQLEDVQVQAESIRGWLDCPVPRIPRRGLGRAADHVDYRGVDIR
jgi:hypothetical protein